MKRYLLDIAMLIGYGLTIGATYVVGTEAAARIIIAIDKRKYAKRETKLVEVQKKQSTSS